MDKRELYNGSVVVYVLPGNITGAEAVSTLQSIASRDFPTWEVPKEYLESLSGYKQPGPQAHITYLFFHDTKEMRYGVLDNPAEVREGLMPQFANQYGITNSLSDHQTILHFLATAKGCPMYPPEGLLETINNTLAKMELVDGGFYFHLGTVEELHYINALKSAIAMASILGFYEEEEEETCQVH